MPTPTPASDVSHLTTLSALAKSAEARTPLPAPAIVTAGSGLIDLKAMEQRAREAAAAPRAVPVAAAVSTAPMAIGAPSEPDFAVTMNARRQRTRRILGALAGAAAVLALAGLWIASGTADPAPAEKPTAAAVAEAHPAASAPIPPPGLIPAPVPVPTGIAPAPPSIASAASPAPKAARGGNVRRSPAHSAAHGPRMTKVASSGTSSP